MTLLIAKMSGSRLRNIVETVSALNYVLIYNQV